MLYRLAKPLLYRLEPETAHNLTLKLLALFPELIRPQSCPNPCTLMGLTFPNRLGIAAGLDKNALALKALDNSGIGFIEIGTLTPKPQSGNPKPRLFRLTQQQAIINRMGFNNDGASKVCARVALIKANLKALIGINIGKNKTTPNEHAIHDYQQALHIAYPHADYITINLSSPNTENLRDLQHGQALATLLSALKKTQHQLHDIYQRHVPLVVKIAPDNSPQALEQILETLHTHEIDGIIATNTTINQQSLPPHLQQQGGLSGAPLTAPSTEILRHIRRQLPDIPLIASGGVMSPKDLQDKLNAGADLVQLYSGLIYQGPALIKHCLQSLNPPQN